MQHQVHMSIETFPCKHITERTLSKWWGASLTSAINNVIGCYLWTAGRTKRLRYNKATKVTGQKLGDQYLLSDQSAIFLFSTTFRLALWIVSKGFLQGSSDMEKQTVKAALHPTATSLHGEMFRHKDDFHFPCNQKEFCVQSGTKY
jgi:hypothetical protein